jgi:5'-phosphate synthase pdxT subunit
LQGAFVEHHSALECLPYHREFERLLVKTVEDLNCCDALIIPGGGKRIIFHLFLPIRIALQIESTTIALLARIFGLLDPLRQFSKEKPIWGTCAGAIFLSQNVKNAKKGGQELLGAMSVTIARNGWGSQVLVSCSNVVHGCLSAWFYRSNPLRLS